MEMDLLWLQNGFVMGTDMISIVGTGMRMAVKIKTGKLKRRNEGHNE